MNAPKAVHEVDSAFAEGQHQRYRAKEHEAIEIPVGDFIREGRLELYEDVIGQNLFSVHLRKDRLLLQAGGVIGLIPLNARLSVEVVPRVQIANLGRMLRMSEVIPAHLLRFKTRYDTDEESVDSLFDVFTDALLEGIDRIRQSGLLRNSRSVSGPTSFPRGRIMVGQSISYQARGQQHRVETSQFLPTTDTPINRCIKYALWLLSQRLQTLPDRAGSIARKVRLISALAVFGGVALDRQRRFLLAEDVKRPSLGWLRSYYEHPLEIAKMVIEGKGVVLPRLGATVVLPTLLLKLDTIFEAYIRRVLNDAIPDPFRVLDGNRSAPDGGQRLLFDADSAVALTASPDVVIHNPSSTAAALPFPVILDMKYKPITGAPDRADLNQAIAYAAAYRALDVIVVHPKADSSPLRGLRTVGTIDGRTVHAFAFDLNAFDIASEERELSSSVKGILGI